LVAAESSSDTKKTKNTQPTKHDVELTTEKNKNKKKTGLI